MTDSVTLPTATAAQARVFLWERLHPHRGTAMAAGVVALATSACVLVPPLATGRIIDRISEPGATFGDVLTPLALIMASLLLGAVLSWWGAVLFARVAEPTVATLREDVVSHALALEPGVIEKAGTGELVSRVGDDSRLISTAVSTVLPQVLAAGSLLVLSVPGLFSLHWALGLAGLVGVPMYIASLRWYLPRSAPLYRAEREILARRTTRFLDDATGRDALISQGWEDAELARLDADSDETRRTEDRVYRMVTRYFQRNNRAEYVVTVAILVVGFVLVDASWTTVGAVTAAALLYHRLFNPIAEVIGTFDRIQEAGIALRRLAGVTLSPVSHPAGTTQPLQGAGGAAPGLELRGVHHSFDAEHAVLTDIDLYIAPGECVALVGATGAGKTTAARILAGIVPVRQGSATLDGIDLDVLGTALRPRVVLASQHTHVFAATLRQNLTLGAGETGDSTIEDAVRACGADWILDLPEGLDTRVGDDGHHLTAHQAQHLALVRLLLLDPGYVVLDEATAEDGSINSRVLDRASAQVIAGRGALVIAHRLSQARLADRILVMDAGRIVENGTHADLVSAGGRYATLWAAWTGDAGRGES
ncbi:ABC transporter ATP-binding protein [Corynebacterium sp.]|jgi:ATP-binding cassette subfamily C protein|uniref:ABC transporter ATP-binding protein n=1 Tax=Corynebacterium sp. TaxID=1720 RepID=UPI0025BF6943|nr:ABC transporter ATP-binding protein [Corynebacterium sp.]